jgi:hypothetical protein
MSCYEYKPLDPSKREFQLLHILPENHPTSKHAASAAAVRCTITHATLNDAPDYNALLYTWGDVSIKVPILVNGIELRATLNLEMGLRHLRRKDEIMTL